MRGEVRWSSDLEAGKVEELSHAEVETKEDNGVTVWHSLGWNVRELVLYLGETN